MITLAERRRKAKEREKKYLARKEELESQGFTTLEIQQKFEEEFRMTHQQSHLWVCGKTEIFEKAEAKPEPPAFMRAWLQEV